MTDSVRARRLDALRQFLRSIQKPGRSVDALAPDDLLVASGLIDSLAIMQIVVYLEETYGVDFAANGFDPDRLATMDGIVDLVGQAGA